jgi:hypothetical protein
MARINKGDAISVLTAIRLMLHLTGNGRDKLAPAHVLSARMRRNWSPSAAKLVFDVYFENKSLADYFSEYQ